MSPADLHVTLFVAGFPTDAPEHDDDVGWSVLQRQRDRLRFPGFSIEVGAANSFSSAPFLEVWDVGGGIARVRSQLAGEGSEQRFAAYQPHLTIGTYRRSEAAAPVRAVLQRWREAPRVQVGVSSVELVTFDATRAGSALETVFSVECVRGV